jgi:hypothetical protein
MLGSLLNAKAYIHVYDNNKTQRQSPARKAVESWELGKGQNSQEGWPLLFTTQTIVSFVFTYVVSSCLYLYSQCYPDVSTSCEDFQTCYCQSVVQSF